MKLSQLKIEKPVLVLTHSLADSDAVCSALALKTALKCDAMLADIMTGQPKSILSFLKIKNPFVRKNIHDYKTLVITDTNTYGLLGKIGEEIKRFKGKTIIIDHHSQRKDTIKTKYKIINQEIPSTCQLLFSMLDKVDKKTAALLLFGIVSDSANFKNANVETFSIISKLLKKSGLVWEDVVYIFDENRNFSNKLTNLKAVKSCSAVQFGTILLTTSIVSTFEGLVADAFIDLGADIAFVGAIGKSETRISARMHPSIKTIRLDRLMQGLGEANKGTGGGHRCAAGANLPLLSNEKLQNFLEKCTAQAIKELKKQKIAKGKIKRLF